MCGHDTLDIVCVTIQCEETEAVLPSWAGLVRGVCSGSCGGGDGWIGAGLGWLERCGELEGFGLGGVTDG
jgi:hypothetical protein